jgi:hypothetical protein
MPTEKRAELFIRLLADALEADRVIRRELLALQHKARARRFMQQCRSDLNLAMDSIEPLDCVQMMAEEA